MRMQHNLYGCVIYHNYVRRIRNRRNFPLSRDNDNPKISTAEKMINSSLISKTWYCFNDIDSDYMLYTYSHSLLSMLLTFCVVFKNGK